LSRDTIRLGKPPIEGPDRLAEIARAKGIHDQRLLRALASVPRAAFVPPEYVERAYSDEPIPIGHGQVTTQPSLSAAMLEALGLQGDERALEVGSGHGYQTALLSRLAGQVFSIERIPDLAETTRRNLDRQGIQNVEVVVGDGTRGLPERGPFEAIVVSAAFTRVPQPLVSQLREGGRLVQPIGEGGSDQVTSYVRQGGKLERLASVIPARFVRLYGDHGFTPEDRAVTNRRRRESASR
jgi:protein-L-isoaspartate(D-aspartate) O-methyltransferase